VAEVQMRKRKILKSRCS